MSEILTMTQIKSLNFSQNNESNQSKSLKQFVFTLQDGKLVYFPEDALDPKSICEDFQSVSSEGFRVVDNPEDEIYIEIFRENNELSCQGIRDDKPITSISSAHEAFWEGDFEERTRRQTCILCGQVFLTPQQLLHHLQNLHKIAYPEECFVCHTMFVDMTQRMEHLYQDHAVSEPNLICEVCFEKFVSQEERDIHRLFHESVIQCQWCKESFQCKFLLNSHLHHCLLRRTDLECHICGCSFRSSQILQLHSLRHNRTACDICHDGFLNKPNFTLENNEVALIRHMKNRHSIDEINTALESLKKQDEEEEILDKMFMNQIEATLNTFHDTPVCGRSNHLTPQVEDSINSENLDATHCTSTLEEGAQAQDEAVEVSSEASTPTQSSLLLMNSSYIGKQQHDFICSTCSCTCESQAKLKAHEDTHAVTAFQCSDCNMDFKSKEKFLTHTLDHQNIFTCSVCLSKFPHRRGFKKHMRSHGIQVTPETVWYNCNLCAVSCATKSGLRNHILTHTDHKPYLCDKCGLKFRRPRALKIHDLAVHSPRTVHYCPHCDISSFSKTSLLRHIQCVHGRVKRFICGVCSARCFQNQDLRRHLKAMHSVNLPAMDSLCKKSNEEIHVIPPAENLDPADPLSQLLQSAIREEQLKLEALKLQSTKSNVHHSGSELLLDNRQSLNILGDVASKAAPLEHPDPGSTLNLSQPSINPRSQETSKLSCGGRQYVSSSSDALTTNFSQHVNLKSPLQANVLKDAVPAASPKPLIIYSFAPTYSTSFPCSATSCATGLPVQFCALPSTNIESASLESGPESIISSDLIGSFPPASSSSTLQCRNVASVFSGTMNNLNSIAASNFIEPSKSCQFEFLNISSNNVIGGESSRVDLNVGPLCRVLPTFMPQMKSRLSRGEILENSTQEEECAASNISQKSNNTLQTSKTELSSSIKRNTTNSEETKNAKFTYVSNQPKVIQSSDEGFPFLSSSSQTFEVEVVSSASRSLQDINNGIVPAECQNVVNIISNEDTLVHCPSIDVEAAPEAHKAIGKSSASDVGSSELFLKSDGSDSSNLRPQIENSNLSNSIMMNGTTTCPECGKQLSCTSNYKRHLQIHKNDKPHKCPSCQKSFQYKYNLTVHLRSHTGDRPYECHVCKKKFRYQNEYKEHKQLHEEFKSFKCLDCGQSFARQRDLKRHSLYHRRTSKPTCHVCQKAFSRMDYLKRHIKSHGKVEDTDKNVFEEDRTTLSQKEILYIANEENEKLSRESETSYVCELCCILIGGESEFQEHKRSCQGSEEIKDGLSVQNEESLPRDSSEIDFNVQGNPCSLPGNSEDLISLALQAAEDGVEFTFMEGLKSSLQQPVDDNSESTVVYIQFSDPNQRHL